MVVFDFLNAFFDDLFTSIGIKKNISNTYKKSYSNKKYASKPIELNNKNIVYPNNKLEKEIEGLYAEIREMQSKSSTKSNLANRLK